MKTFRSRIVLSVSLVMTLSAAFAQTANPEVEPSKLAQSAADVIRTAAGADIAFLPAAMIKKTDKVSDLADLVLYPNDQIAVMKLKGSQIRKALERSASLYPMSNGSFLQLSGMEAGFSKSAQPDHRITSVSVGNSPLSDSKDYTAAMPQSLAEGSLGYFRVWDAKQVVRTLGGSIGSALKGTKPTDTPARWTIGS